jgi:hypothetical protein
VISRRPLPRKVMGAGSCSRGHGRKLLNLGFAFGKDVLD